MINIDRQIPLPIQRCGPNQKYPWDTMRVGDSFLFADGSKATALVSVRNRAHPETKFVTRKTPQGVRCWRVEQKGDNPMFANELDNEVRHWATALGLLEEQHGTAHAISNTAMVGKFREALSAYVASASDEELVKHASTLYNLCYIGLDEAEREETGRVQ